VVDTGGRATRVGIAAGKAWPLARGARGSRERAPEVPAPKCRLLCLSAVKGHRGTDVLHKGTLSKGP